MRRSIIGSLLLSLPTLLGCSSGSPATANAPELTASTPPGSRAVVHLSARAGESTPLAVQVSPDAECTMRDVTPAPELFASARGILRFVAQVPEGGTSLALDCTRADGATDAYELDVASAAAGETPLTSNVDESTLAPGASRAPLTDDPLLLSDEQLVARGFPPPPNRDASSPAYAQWLSLTREPAIRMTPHARRARERLAGAGAGARSSKRPLLDVVKKPQVVSYTTDPHWSGYIAEPDDATWEVSGSWDVPKITATGLSSMGQWVGIGGWYDGDEGLIQAGSAAQTGIGMRGAIVTSYNAFYEYWITGAWPHYLHPDPSWPGSTSTPPTEWVAPVGPGDSYQVTVWAGDSRGNTALGAGYGWFFVEAHPSATTSNPYPSAEFYIGSLPTPAGAPPSQGWSAEWIVERSSVNQLPNFGATSIGGAVAYGPSGYVQTPGDANPAEVSAITNGTNDLDVAYPESGGVGFSWLRAN